MFTAVQSIASCRCISFGPRSPNGQSGEEEETDNVASQTPTSRTLATVVGFPKSQVPMVACRQRDVAGLSPRVDSTVLAKSLVAFCGLRLRLMACMVHIGILARGERGSGREHRAFGWRHSVGERDGVGVFELNEGMVHGCCV